MGQNVEKGKEEKNSVPQKSEGSISERFTAAVVKEFSALVGPGTITLSPMQKRLAQHLFIKIDAALNDLEKKRQDKNKDGAPIVWSNMNMQKLAVDAVHRVELGLDALIPNHISPIPYWNTRAKKYDLDLRVGYAGKDYYRRQMAVEQPVDIIYELVRKNDVFVPIKKSKDHTVETYTFDIPKPFERGVVVGGFAYLVFTDQSKNKLVIVTEEDFKKSENKAQSKDFWGGYPDEMRYKTLVIKGTNKLQIDPAKVNASFAAVEKDDATDAVIVGSEIAEHANKGTVIDLTAEQESPSGPGTPPECGPGDTPPPPPACTCDEMIQGGVKAFDCAFHGRYENGKFTPPSSRKPSY